ncbi:LytR C-terminal domain-containing protein [Nocardia sp. NBC_01730]|uniref:LytR C-terminal domain-containing protein n=1 Tax=Nocardia sp. NBC_01730 TaxID=2975998 RepID=UPI002E0F6466|nr:LytR C-terminal domain-containing protein [Nocardia sp. NBC_01730]
MSYPNPTSGGPPLRALAMVLIALAIVFAGLGAMSLSNSETGDTDASATSPSATSSAAAAPQVPAGTTTPKTNAAPTSAGATTTPSSTAAGHSVPVRVLNNSMVAGLAAKTASQLSANGWTIAETGNYPGTNIAKTTVYYGTSPGDREAARAIADEIGADVAPKSSGIGDSAPGVTVIVTGN